MTIFWKTFFLLVKIKEDLVQLKEVQVIQRMKMVTNCEMAQSKTNEHFYEHFWQKIERKRLCRAGETDSSLTIKNEMLSLTLNLLSNLLKAKTQKSNTSVNMHHAVLTLMLRWIFNKHALILFTVSLSVHKYGWLLTGSILCWFKKGFRHTDRHTHNSLRYLHLQL